MSSDYLNSDLPLMSNVNDLLVKHYLFNFKCDFQRKLFTCVAVLLLESVDKEESSILNCSCQSQTLLQDSTLPDPNDRGNTCGFALVLDCHQIAVDEVVAIESLGDRFLNCDPSLLVACEKLNFSVHEWSLKIWSNAARCKHAFPKMIKISYSTLPLSPSLLWVHDQDRNPAVFTYGSFINNRSLFPCQEPPVAMATWEATVSVPPPAVVLMSGDVEAQISRSEECVHYYYYTKRDLPLSTLCLAVGHWKEHVFSSKHKNSPKCRLFAGEKLFDRSVQEFSEYIPSCLRVSEDILGAYPFDRIDFLIVPPTFSSLGMASPNIIFLSQSLICGDGSMCSSVAHEIAHAWFGLNIGALDWSEEWLSEGFATFFEDHFHAQTSCMQNRKDYFELTAFIKKKILMDEVANTDEHLQVMRPSHGEVQTNVIDGIDSVVVKNGLDPMKGFMKVHYIKGFFLLKYLSDAVGDEAFLKFLQTYVIKFEGKLVTSEEFFEFFFLRFADMKQKTDDIFKNWLHSSDIPDEIINLKPSSENKMFEEVLKETQMWKNLNKMHLKKKLKKKPKYSLDGFNKALTAEQVIILLENVLEEDILSARTLSCLNEFFDFKKTNVQVQHRWFELVVQHRYKSEYEYLKSYLMDHSATGVYLYGEMIFSQDKDLKGIAKECFSLLESEMEPNVRSTLQQMFSDSEDLNA